MKHSFRRHLLDGDAEVWPAEGPADRGDRLRVPKGDDETLLSSAPSGWGRGGTPAEGPADKGDRLRVPKGDDETPLLSAPSGLPNARN